MVPKSKVDIPTISKIYHLLSDNLLIQTFSYFPTFLITSEAKSKRLSCSKKYTIQKNVREHHRKLRKEARANPQLHKKKKKDPGIPNLFPLKEKMLQVRCGGGSSCQSCNTSPIFLILKKSKKLLPLLANRAVQAEQTG